MIQEQHVKGAKKLVQEAKANAASRKKSSETDLHHACLDGAKYIVRRPASVSFSVPNAPRRAPKRCFVCQTVGGTFYRENGKDWCSTHKEMMYWPDEEVKRYKQKERLSC